MIHKARLYLLKKRLEIVLFIAATIVLTTFILVFAALVQIHKQSARNEQILKGLSCILLILPENRTQEKVSECIRVNDASSADFLFKTLSEPQKTDVSIEPVGDKSLYVVPIKGDKGDQGPQGPQGLQGPAGLSIKGDKGDTIVIEGPAGKDGADGSNGREVEFQYNPEAEQIEWRYVGDEGWQVLVDQCVLTNTCQE